MEVGISQLALILVRSANIRSEEEYTTVCGYSVINGRQTREIKQLRLTDPNGYPECPASIEDKDEYGNWVTLYLLYELPGG
ncbi:hypothetical protein MAH1_04950 [Sessilibacter sp. MAH1]